MPPRAMLSKRSYLTRAWLDSQAMVASVGREHCIVLADACGYFRFGRDGHSYWYSYIKLNLAILVEWININTG